jgi:hypothetical protein
VKEQRYPLQRKLGGPQSRSGCFGEEKKKSLATTGSQTPEPPAGSLLTKQTRLLRLLTYVYYLCMGGMGGRKDGRKHRDWSLRNRVFHVTVESGDANWSANIACTEESPLLAPPIKRIIFVITTCVIPQSLVG